MLKFLFNANHEKSHISEFEIDIWFLLINVELRIGNVIVFQY